MSGYIIFSFLIFVAVVSYIRGKKGGGVLDRLSVRFLWCIL